MESRIDRPTTPGASAGASKEVQRLATVGRGTSGVANSSGWAELSEESPVTAVLPVKLMR